MQTSLPEASIRDRAYLLWESDGRAHGRAEYYWHQAVLQLEEEGRLREDGAVEPLDGSISSARKPTTKLNSLAQRADGVDEVFANAVAAPPVVSKAPSKAKPKAARQKAGTLADVVENSVKASKRKTKA